MAVSTHKAELYRRFRLAYAPGTAERILEMSRLGADAVVIELGSGTGLLTQPFLGSCSCVFAVEPEDSFRVLAEADLAAHPGFVSVKARAESTGLPDYCSDIAIAANALHRLDLTGTLKELRRVLRAPGYLASVRYKLKSQHLVDALVPRLEKLAGWKKRNTGSIRVVDESEFFEAGTVREESISASHEESEEEFIGAALAGMESPSPGDSDYGPFVESHRKAFGEIAENGVFSFHYDTVIALGRIRQS